MALLAWLPAGAQGPGITIQQASLRLWPEYDDPGLLVIYAGTLADSATLPQQVAFPLPEGARGIQATVQDPTAGLLNQPWEIADGKLTYTLPQASFHVEYYVDRPPSGDQRELNYIFQTPYPITTLQVDVQQPARSSGFSVTPQPESSFVGTDGLTYYRINRANLAPGDTLAVTIRYTKTDPGLSNAVATTAEGQPTTQAGAPVPASTAPTNTWLPWLLISVGVVALAGLGTYWFLGQRQTGAPARAAKTARPGTARQPRRSPADGKAVYCTQCGRQLGPKDRFCAHCGARRKS